MEQSLVFVFVENLILVLPIGVVLVLLDQWPIDPWVLGVDLPSPRGWLDPGLCFYIYGLLYYFVLCSSVLSLVVKLGFYRRT